MIIKIILLFFILCVSNVGIAQKLNSVVISSAGDVNKTDRMYLEWTLGEPFVESVSSNNNLLTQGFHQPLKILANRPAVSLVKQEVYTISILPNPVQTIFRVVIKRENISRLFLELSDMNGRAILNKTSIGQNEIIPFNLSPFSSGVYTLTIRNKSGSVYKTFKIIKTL